jgi:hypothetical protein
MRTHSVFGALAIMFIVGAVPAVKAGQGQYPASLDENGPYREVDTGLFYDDLAPHGDWVESPDYGWVFVPRVPPGWRPYTVGHWVWTDEYGWLWASDEPFGWAVYHYGRWYEDPAYGWAWVPGSAWGPAWVTFRSGGGYIGWAPLPPRVGWQVGLGFNIGSARFDTLIGPPAYCFVPERAFVEASIHRYVVPVGRNTTIVNETTNVTNITVVENRVVNRSVSPQQVAQATGRPVPRARAVEVNTVAEAHRAPVKGSEVRVFRPAVRQAPEKTPPHAKALPRRDAEAARSAPATGGNRAPAPTPGANRAPVPSPVPTPTPDPKARPAETARGPAELERQRQQLEKRQAVERQQLEREHDKELKRPPQDVAPEALEKRHEQEHRALEERQYKQKQQQLDSQQQRERISPQERRGPEPKANAEAKPSKENAKPKAKPTPKPTAPPSKEPQ